MVKISVFSCPHCGETAEIREGVGSRDTLQDVFYWDDENPPFLQEYVSPAIFRQAMKHIENGFEPAAEFGYLRYYCPICKVLEMRFYFRLEKEGKQWSPAYQCGRCRSHLTPALQSETNEKKRKKGAESTRYLRCRHCGGLIDTADENR
ncbi:MAG: hypothetical protein E7Z72_06480 [Methanocorpusculum parvum]|nr:hypothetical protein [Methanocorpusculum parvum]